MISVINRKKNRSSFEPSRGKKKFSGKWVYRLVAILFLATVIFALFFSDFLSVTDVQISGLNKLEDGPLRNAINGELSGNYFGIIARDNLILLRRDKLREALLRDFKRIEDVQVEKIFPDSLRIVIRERKFAMLLCSSGNCYVLNEKGEAYGAQNFAQAELDRENLVTLIDASGAQIEPGSIPLEGGFQEFILGLNSRVQNDAGIVLKKLYETPSRMSGDLKVETEDGWKIYFSEDVGLEKELLMLKTILANKISRDQQKNLEYIDLRIANKVFYKFKEGTEKAQEQATENTPAPAPEVKKGEDGKKKK